MKPYPQDVKKAALIKVRDRGSRTLESIAVELHVPLGTLKNWLQLHRLEQSRAGVPHAAPLPEDGSVRSWTAAQRLQALLESYALKDEALAAWCRQKGLFEHQLQAWTQAFCLDVRAADPAQTELRDLRREHTQLQRELQRKDKALAETAALLVLQKKFQALLGAQDV
jgi:transposase-like protein